LEVSEAGRRWLIKEGSEKSGAIFGKLEENKKTPNTQLKLKEKVFQKATTNAQHCFI
jgi:hypothetical protein